jgi:hypothetical protein
MSHILRELGDPAPTVVEAPVVKLVEPAKIEEPSEQKDDNADFGS